MSSHACARRQDGPNDDRDCDYKPKSFQPGKLITDWNGRDKFYPIPGQSYARYLDLSSVRDITFEVSDTTHIFGHHDNDTDSPMTLVLHDEGTSTRMLPGGSPIVKRPEATQLRQSVDVIDGYPEKSLQWTGALSTENGSDAPSQSIGALSKLNKTDVLAADRLYLREGDEEMIFTRDKKKDPITSLWFTPVPVSPATKIRGLHVTNPTVKLFISPCTGGSQPYRFTLAGDSVAWWEKREEAKETLQCRGYAPLP